MSTSLKSVTDIEADASSDDKEFKPKLFNNNRSFKSKENIYKHKYNKELKKKLKKYKLRRDGQEDPEVLDVSQILVKSLKIKSPNNNLISRNGNDTNEELKPKNYLFRMGRKKQVNKQQKKVEVEDGTEFPNNKVENRQADIPSVMTIDENIDISNSTDKAGTSVSLKFKSNKNEKPKNYSSKKNKDKKQTNAFALMMDSRNKSIGSNSPGKEKVNDELHLQDIVEKKSIKAKRTLLLQQMAEAKGSLKKKEIEEFQEKCIKKKMDKRAERLKNMISGSKTKTVAKEEIKTPSNDETIDVVDVVSIKDDEDSLLSSQNNKLKLISIFNDTIQAQNISKSKKEMITDAKDEEFLKKLSPSLKKKENMLCYFKKVEKDQEDIFDSNDLDNDSCVIKVKLKSKGKNKIKKKKLSLNHNHGNKCELNSSNNDKIIDAANSEEPRREETLDNKVNISKTDDSVEPTEYDIPRPRRNVKRPAKYIDDMRVSSSDEELHIFTPKKKKQAEQQSKCVIDSKVTLDEMKHNNNKKSIKSNDKIEKKLTASLNIKLKKENAQPKKHTKLAPIFAVKPQLDAAAIEAKQKFLSSGVPDKLKKTIEKQNSPGICVNLFHTVVHVQQNIDVSSDILPKSEITFNQSDESDEETERMLWIQDFFKKSLKNDPKREETKLTDATKKTQTVLLNLKELYPKFPVYRTYRLLKDKNRGEFKDYSYLDLDNSIEVINGMIDINNGSPDRLSWTDKYKAMSSKQIIGNFETIKELKKWLISWTENDSKSKKNNNANSDSSDFYLSDTDSKDSMKSTNNLLVLTGPVGSGKTSLVYAVAAELAIKVLEVNASNKRTGKIMLQDLQEATQSHKVNRGKSSQELSQKSQEVSHNEKPKVNKKQIFQKSQEVSHIEKPKLNKKQLSQKSHEVSNNEKPKLHKKRGRPKKVTEQSQSKKSEPIPKTEVLSQPTSSQGTSRTCMSLILIDDADIVFDQDDGFYAAIVQLIHCSKRPVILITSTTSCPNLQRFLQCAKVICTRPLLPRMLGTWLDIMCLADTDKCWPGLGAKCLDYFKGDIRKSINFLQFKTANDSIMDDDSTPKHINDYRANIEDENSNMSWSDRDGVDDNSENTRINHDFDDIIWQKFMKEEASLLSYKHPLNVFEMWWNIPRLLITPIHSNNDGKSSKITRKLELDTMSKVADIISVSDYFCSKNHRDSDVICVPWMSFESHSVSEHECLDKYDKNSELMSEISHSLMTDSIIKAQVDLQLKTGLHLQFPEMTSRRYENRIADRHCKLSNFLSPSAILDRRALALDYWSGCRTICRVEKTRTESNLKRNNRFCHYLKSANILCKSDSFDNLANSLYCNNEQYNS